MKRISLLTVVLLISLIIFRNNILLFCNNVYNLFFLKNDYKNAEIRLLEEKIKYLENEYDELNDFKENLGKYANYKYVVSKKIYQENYFYNSKIIIEGGEDLDIKKGMAVVNEFGLVGVISNVNKNTSEITKLLNVNNLSVNINGIYGKLVYEDNKLKIKDISRENVINLNDEVYTSTLGSIKEKIYIGKVISVKDKVIEKEIIIESKVDFNNLNYLLVVGDL